MRKIILLATLALAGCTTTKPTQVPVPMQCPKPYLPAEPHYAAQDLKPGDSDAQIKKALVATVGRQQDYIRLLQKGYQKPKS